MPRLCIDDRSIEVPPGTTVLAAARQLGIEIPTLCYLDGCEPQTSCLVCMVKIRGSNRLTPACGTPAADGMEVESETAEVHQVRRSALELLLSDHLGDCLAPCWFTCPANMDIPLMLRQIAAGDLPAAVATVKRDIALPAVLGRICPAPCEKACRRGAAGAAVSICQLKRLVADVDLASGNPYQPLCQPLSGKRVAIVGAGPTGLAAAYYLAQQGHACTLFDENAKPGGRLFRETTEAGLPREVLDAEIATILGLGIEVRTACRVERVTTVVEGGALGWQLPGQLGWQLHCHSDAHGTGDGSTAAAPTSDPVTAALTTFDAVLIAAGATAAQQAAAWGLRTGPRGVQIKAETFETSLPGVFAAGNAIRGKGMVIRSVADGKEAAVSIGQYLTGETVTGAAAPFSTKIGRMEADELRPMLDLAGNAPRQEPSGGFSAGYSPAEGAEQAARCMHCDCRGLNTCKLRRYAALYGAEPRRYKAERRRFQQDSQHAEVLFEPGKCIDCGLCIQIAAAAGEPLGLTFIGRGFDVRVGVPLNHSLAEALRKVAADCVAACPTAALAWKTEPA